MASPWEYMCIIIYILALIITFRNHYKAVKHFDCACSLISIYIFCAITSLILYDLTSNKWSISLLPFVYLYIVFYISLKPILLFNNNKISKIQEPPVMTFNILCIIFIISSILSFGDSLSNIPSKIAMLVTETSAGKDLYGDTAELSVDSGKGVSNIFSVLTNFLFNIEVLFFFYLLTIRNKNRTQNIISILLAIVLTVDTISSMLNGQRGGLVNRVLLIISTFFLLKPLISEKINRIITKVGVVSLILISIPFLAITTSRFGEMNDGGLESLYQYSGQNILNFNEYAFDNNGIRYGDRTLPVLKKMLLFDNVPDNYIERRAKYPYLKINDESFITYIGDFVLDFGPIFTFILFSIVTVIFIKQTKIRSGIYPFHKLILLHLLVSIIAQGVFLFNYADISNLIIVTYLLIYFIFRTNFSRIVR